jgi:hypothetical protein
MAAAFPRGARLPEWPDGGILVNTPDSLKRGFESGLANPWSKETFVLRSIA